MRAGRKTDRPGGLSYLVAVLALMLSGCAGQTSRKPPIYIFPDMDRQERYNPQTESPLFSDRRASRPPVPGTVARGMLKEDEAFYTGLLANNQYVGKNP